MKNSVFGRALAIVATTLALAGCSQLPPEPARPVDSTAVEVPEFTGAWASDFASAYRRATTDFERSALSDGVVTEAEFAEMEDRFSTCMHDKGVEFTGFNPGGGYEFRPGAGMTSEDANRVADECSARSGLDTIGQLFFAQHRNPQNLDDATIIAACLVERRVVPQGYSAHDYTRDAPTKSFPFVSASIGEKALDACSRDPLGLFLSENER